MIFKRKKRRATRSSRFQTLQEKTSQITLEEAREERSDIRGAMEKKMNRDMARIRRAKWAAVLFTLLLIASGVLYFWKIRPIVKYNAAVRAMESGQYDAAVEQFTAMGAFRDAETLILESKYRKAQLQLDSEKYAEASRAFADLADYKESATLAQESVYLNAEVLEAEGENVRAAREFSKVEGYRDASERALALLYQEGQALEAAGALEDAYAVYASISGCAEADSRLGDAVFAEAAAAAAEKWSGIQVGDVVTLGVYEQDNIEENGPEPIEWIVLDVSDGYAALISRYAIEMKMYTTGKARCTWETCSLRVWLNDTFYPTAFTRGEQAMIPLTVLSTEDNPSSPYHVSGGNDTKDMVFLLSIAEARRYFATDADRVCELTEYASALGAYRSQAHTAWWWLRTPGNFGAYAAYVFADGSISDYGNLTQNVGEAVRPAFFVKLP